MKTAYGHLTYCSNIHSGETWEDHFARLRENIPLIKKALAPQGSFGIGLRLANVASETLHEPSALQVFKQWLTENDCYVFTMNGFPYGYFHHKAVKDQVHAPDWLTPERVTYTLRLAEILAQLLPTGMEGSISTSPLSYRHWHSVHDRKAVLEAATANLLQVVKALTEIRQKTGKIIHIDIEPEPDGLLDNGTEFLQWYVEQLLPLGITYLTQNQGLDKAAAEEAIKTHVRLCYDVCHFAVGYENHAEMIEKLEANDIRTGKIQISAALKSLIGKEVEAENEKLFNAFSAFDEPVYLHQVVARSSDGTLLHYRDMPGALADYTRAGIEEWRAHYHVPVFIEQFDILRSTQEDIKTVLNIQKKKPFTHYLEVETYTWEVLPPALRLPIDQSISRELQWVKEFLEP